MEFNFIFSFVILHILAESHSYWELELIQSLEYVGGSLGTPNMQRPKQQSTFENVHNAQNN